MGSLTVTSNLNMGFSQTLNVLQKKIRRAFRNFREVLMISGSPWYQCNFLLSQLIHCLGLQALGLKSYQVRLTNWNHFMREDINIDSLEIMGNLCARTQESKTHFYKCLCLGKMFKTCCFNKEPE